MKGLANLPPPQIRPLPFLNHHQGGSTDEQHRCMGLNSHGVSVKALQGLGMLDVSVEL